jgi:hypothetical protein
MNGTSGSSDRDARRRRAGPVDDPPAHVPGTPTTPEPDRVEDADRASFPASDPPESGGPSLAPPAGHDG